MPKKNMDENINKYIGKRIQEIRKEKGLKQDYLAEKTRVTRPNISKYETGEIAIPLDILKKISKTLDTSTDYLLGLTNCKTPKTNYRALCVAIGIDDTAAEILEEFNFVYGGQYLIPILNFLIKQELLPPDETFFEEQYLKIENAKTTAKEKKKAMRRVQSLYDRIYKRWQDKNCQPFLSSIEDYFITKAEDKNLCLTLSGELKEEKDITNEIEKSNIRKKITIQELLEEKQLEEIIESLKKAKQKYKKEVEKKK